MNTLASTGDERMPRTREAPLHLRGWAPIVCLPAVTLLFVPDHWPRWALMWTLAGSIFVGCKWLTWRRTRVAGIPWWRHAGYLMAWPGLDALAFLTQSSTTPPALREWCAAAL